MASIKEIMEMALGGIIECPECGSTMEPDAEACYDCGWENPLVKLWLI